MPGYRLSVNGTEVHLDLPGRTPLLFVLRNDLGLKGAKLGCGAGNCGACTVLVDGQAVNACSVNIWDIDGASIETVEGAGQDAVYSAFLEGQAAQCAYCIPGIMMTARAMLRRPEPPTDAEIIEVLSERHLCRCGTHARILSAIRRARDAA